MGEIRNGAWIQTYTGKQFLTMDARHEEVDMVLLATEKAVLIRKQPALWMKLPEPLAPKMIKCWGPEEAEKAFLDRFGGLFENHNYSSDWR